jgi:hypothetical protein
MSSMKGYECDFGFAADVAVALLWLWKWLQPIRTLRLDNKLPAPVRLPSRIRCTRDSAQTKACGHPQASNFNFNFNYQPPHSGKGKGKR